VIEAAFIPKSSRFYSTPSLAILSGSRRPAALSSDQPRIRATVNCIEAILAPVNAAKAGYRGDGIAHVAGAVRNRRTGIFAGKSNLQRPFTNHFVASLANDV